MSAKRWADEYSSDEGSIDPESDEESEPKVAPNPVSKGSQPSKSAQPVKTSNTQPVRSEQYIAYISSINPAASRMDVGRFFEEKSCAIAKLDLQLSVPVGRNSTAIMELKDANSLAIALTLNGESFQGIPIRTKVFEVRSHQQNQGGAVHRQQPQQGGRGGFRDNRDVPRGPGRNEEDRFPGRRQDAGRDGGRGRGGGTSRERPVSREVAAAPAAPPVPATRPKLNLAPRTLPVDLIGKSVAEETKPDIFGGGKPHDDALYEEKKKTIESKDEASTTDPASVFKLSALGDALPGDADADATPAAAAHSEEAPAATSSTASATAEATTAQALPGAQGSDARPVRGGRGAGGGGRGGGGGRESAERWTKEAPRGGRGGGGVGAGAGRGGGGGGHGRTVEVTGSYVIEKPAADDDESGGKGAKHSGPGAAGTGGGGAAAGKKAPRDNRDSRDREDASNKGFAGKPSKPTPPGREAREPRQADAAEGGGAGAGHTVGAGAGRPKSGAPSSKLFDSAMKQATPKIKKTTGAAAVAVSVEPTAEEKFNKAQESFAGKAKGGAYRSGGTTPTAVGAGTVKKANSFAALLDHSDSEDE